MHLSNEQIMAATIVFVVFFLVIAVFFPTYCLPTKKDTTPCEKCSSQNVAHDKGASC